MHPGRLESQNRKRIPQLVTHWEQKDHQFFLYCPETVLEVSVFSDRILRFRFSPEGRFDDDFSYAVSTDGGMKAPDCTFSFKKVGDVFSIKTDKIDCRISKTLHVNIYDRKGNMICEDEKGFYWDPNYESGGNIVYCSKRIQEKENFFGLGDKPQFLNIRGLRFENWGSDVYGFEKTTDPLYKNIPFYYGLHHNRAYGIFFDNTFRTRFDFGYERSDICTFWAPGGEMNYYFIYGPELLSVAEGYTEITGKPELPPLWALGYQQSKWSYYPESVVKELASEMRRREIPCDVIHLDIEYMDGFRCFTWDEKRFPDPRRLIAELETDGFKTVAIIDPGIKIDRDYKVFQEGIEKKLFCRRADGAIMRANVWPGPCYFPDFTNKDAREWWAGLFQDFMKSGIHGIWNDMNEPAVSEIGTFPMDTRHNYDNHHCSHRKGHNVYGMQMARASYHGVKKAIFPRRPFLISRSGYSGLQRYAAVWTGDNLATWEHLWIANIQCQRLSISGLSFCGSDVGGFIGQSNGELFTRWMQMAVFHPFYRNHSSGDHGDQEPWSFGEPFTAAVKQAIELRYQLLPYIYTVFWRHVESGTPMIRSLAFMDQTDPETYYRMEEFGFGDNIIVCPVHEANITSRNMYLPKGKWYNYWTNEIVEGGKEFAIDVTLEQFPVFVKAGATIPHYPVMQYVGEEKIEVLDLHIYYSTKPYTSELYEDAGEYYDYAQGNFTVRTFSLDAQENSLLNIQQRKKGRFNSEYTEYNLIIHGLPFKPAGMVMDGKTIMFDISELGIPEVFSILVDKDFEELSLKRLDRFA
ncbi:MAG: glycoside hydrolase family 31 protein [Bacteroidetes bacterium]|nr:glycoside hydrolase family 31 protein [Bacteroidota bacterium]MCB0842707.1 glycoside hydrolase family 31 protein [Bacteroidota bacterium]